MRPTYLGFEASKSAIFSTQKSLDITGHNLANIATEGYTRQRVVQTSNYTDNTKTRYAPIKGVKNYGVSVIALEISLHHGHFVQIRQQS